MASSKIDSWITENIGAIADGNVLDNRFVDNAICLLWLDGAIALLPTAEPTVEVTLPTIGEQMS